MSHHSCFTLIRKSKIHAIFLLIFWHAPHAGESSGLVSNILVHVPGIVMFSAGNISGAPACNAVNQWAISLSDPMGKGIMAILLSAQAQGKRVYVRGYTNTCRDWGDRELPSYIVMID
jgi:hypothetical protein